LNNYVINNVEEHDKLKRLVKHLNKTVDDGFDTVVYKKNQLMKCVNQSKPPTKDKPKRYQKIILNKEIEKHIITAYFYNPNAKTIKLSDEIKKQGGSMNMEQLIELMG
jgi:hypothetical protein